MKNRICAIEGMTDQTISKTEIDELLKSIQVSESAFLEKLFQISTKFKTADEILSISNVPTWIALFSIFEKPWETAQIKIAYFWSLVAKSLPKNLKTLPLTFLDFLIKNSNNLVSDILFNACMTFLESEDSNLEDFKEYAEKIYQYSINNEPKHFEKCVTVLRKYAFTEYGSAHFFDMVRHSFGFEIPVKLLNIVHLTARFSKFSPEFDSKICENKILDLFYNLYNTLEGDCLSIISLLDDLSEISSNYNSARFFLGSNFIVLVYTLFSTPFEPSFRSLMKLFANSLSTSFDFDLSRFQSFVKICLGSDLKNQGWNTAYNAFQSLVILLCKKEIIDYLYKKERENFESIVTYFLELKNNLPSSHIGHFFEILSHLFSEIYTDDSIEAALEFIYLRVIGKTRMVNLLKSFYKTEQRAGLLLCLTLGTHRFSVEDLSHVSNGPLTIFLNGTFMGDYENLSLRNDVLRMYLSNPLFAEKISKSNREILDCYLNKNGIGIEKVVVGMENA